MADTPLNWKEKEFNTFGSNKKAKRYSFKTRRILCPCKQMHATQTYTDEEADQVKEAFTREKDWVSMLNF
jgi:hypothetical protein